MTCCETGDNGGGECGCSSAEPQGRSRTVESCGNNSEGVRRRGPNTDLPEGGAGEGESTHQDTWDHWDARPLPWSPAPDPRPFPSPWWWWLFWFGWPGEGDSGAGPARTSDIELLPPCPARCRQKLAACEKCLDDAARIAGREKNLFAELVRQCGFQDCGDYKAQCPRPPCPPIRYPTGPRDDEGVGAGLDAADGSSWGRFDGAIGTDAWTRPLVPVKCKNGWASVLGIQWFPLLGSGLHDMSILSIPSVLLEGQQASPHLVNAPGDINKREVKQIHMVDARICCAGGLIQNFEVSQYIFDGTSRVPTPDLVAPTWSYVYVPGRRGNSILHANETIITNDVVQVPTEGSRVRVKGDGGSRCLHVSSVASSLMAEAIQEYLEIATFGQADPAAIMSGYGMEVCCDQPTYAFQAWGSSFPVHSVYRPRKDGASWERFFMRGADHLWEFLMEGEPGYVKWVDSPMDMVWE